AVIGDEVTLGRSWSVLLGASRSTLRARSYDPISGAAQAGSHYDKSVVTPTASVLYRPADRLTTYATYMESIEPGAIVESTYRNAGEVLKPMLSEQYELGARASLAALQLGAALFQIEKSNERSD